MNEETERLINAIGLRWAAAQALGGMLANPEWMKLAKKEACEPGNGDVPHQFARIAALYAERTMVMVEEREKGYK